ncbi:hypothetical protein RSAG8_13126, partial [Rhizoctonia solani AG-8 WAC10335]
MTDLLAKGGAEVPPTPVFNRTITWVKTRATHHATRSWNRVWTDHTATRPDSNHISERANELIEQLGPSSAADYQDAVKNDLPTERLGDILRNINRVLVGIQHAIIRSQNNKDNTIRALDCLINDRGDTVKTGFHLLTKRYVDPTHHLPVVINGVSQLLSVPDLALGNFLCFFGIDGDRCEDPRSYPYKLKAGREREARVWNIRVS